jgi:hypothetical protein
LRLAAIGSALQTPLAESVDNALPACGAEYVAAAEIDAPATTSTTE